MSNLAFFQQCRGNENPKFRAVVGAVVPAGLEWKPDPKSRSARQLIGHLIGHEQDLIELLDAGVIHHRNQVPFTTLEDGLAQLGQAQTDLDARLGSVSEETWGKAADFLAGEHLIARAPVGGLMWMIFFDSIHHRGQLSTYLRPIGGKVPSIYGPSADSAGPGG